MDNDDIYLVSVEDNGIGIPPNNVPAAFAKVLYSSKYGLKANQGNVWTRDKGGSPL